MHPTSITPLVGEAAGVAGGRYGWPLLSPGPPGKFFSKHDLASVNARQEAEAAEQGRPLLPQMGYTIFNQTLK